MTTEPGELIARLRVAAYIVEEGGLDLLEAADRLEVAADAWHRGRAAGIEECERVNAELAQQRPSERI